MFNNVFIKKYNVIVFKICLERDLYEYKKDVLNLKYNLYSNNEITFDEFYNVYNKIYFDKLKYLISYQFLPHHFL